MQVLSDADLIQVSGGYLNSNEEVLNSMEYYSFFFALFGGAASGIYGLYTNHTVTTMVGNTLTIASSSPNVFWIGLGISWMVGAVVGLGVAIYQQQFNENNS